MALSSRVAFQALANLTSVDAIVSYLNKYDKKYDHLRMQEAVLSRFKGPLLREFEAVADLSRFGWILTVWFVLLSVLSWMQMILKYLIRTAPSRISVNGML